MALCSGLAPTSVLSRAKGKHEADVARADVAGADVAGADVAGAVEAGAEEAGADMARDANDHLKPTANESTAKEQDVDSAKWMRWNGGAGWDRSHGHLPRRSFANLLVPYPNEPRAPRQQNHET